MLALLGSVIYIVKAGQCEAGFNNVIVPADFDFICNLYLIKVLYEHKGCW